MRWIALVCATLVLPACTTLDIKESNFLHPDKAGAAPVAHTDLQAALPELRLREASIAAADGATLRGVIAQQGEARTTVLYFGGNAFHLDQQGTQLLPLIASCGVNVAVFDYRGYGRSEGTPTVESMAADALLAFDYVSVQLPGKVIVHGQSLGSFMAAHVAQQRPRAAGLVLESTATNVADWANTNVPWYVRPFLTLDIAPSLRGVDNVAAAAGYQGPGLVLAGARDRVTPPALGRRVFEAMAPAQRQFILLENAGHNDIFGRAELMPAYCAFVKRAP